MIPIEKIKSLLSNDVTSLFSDDLINNAYIVSFKSINSLISDEACLDALFDSGIDITKYVTNHASYTSDDAVVYSKSGFKEGRRILNVERRNTLGSGADSLYYQCRRISSQKGLSYMINNTASIHYENDRFKPIYFTNDTGGVLIKPDNVVLGTSQHPIGRVYWLSFPTFEQRTDISTFTYTFDLGGKNFTEIVDENTLFYGIPHEAIHLTYVEICLNLLQMYMADFVHEEEDTELVTLLKEHVTALLAKKNEELNLVLPKYGNKKENK